MACSDIEPCLSNAACAGDADCASVMSTSLVVDCYRICNADLYACFESSTFRLCSSHCSEAAYRLSDAHRRTVEACALEEAGGCGGGTLISGCAAGLSCGGEPLEALEAAAEEADARCATRPDPSELHDWACLGQVIRSAAERCMAQSPCGDMEACLQGAVCGGEPDCLDFLSAH